jgi:hypothetical protein
MHESYERDQERLINTAAQTVQTAVTVGAQLWMMRQKPIKVEMKTASDDLREIRQGISQGKSSEEIKISVQNGDTYRRIARSGYDADKYTQLMMRQAEIQIAVEMNPSLSLQEQKTPRKTL